jgi:hypothetical protein
MSNDPEYINIINICNYRYSLRAAVTRNVNVSELATAIPKQKHNRFRFYKLIIINFYLNSSTQDHQNI